LLNFDILIISLKISEGIEKRMKRFCIRSIIFLIFVGLIFVYIFFKDDIKWAAISALGSIVVVIWAIFQQGIMRWMDRPILSIPPYKQEPPYFRPATQFIGEGTSQKVLGKGYYVNVEIINKGKTLARFTQPHLTALWTYSKEKEWNKTENWIPLGLEWVLDEIKRQATGRPTEERNLVPSRPYRFNLFNLSTSHRDGIMLRTVFYPSAQPTMFGPGKYCFEITVTAERCNPVKKYFWVDWKGGCAEDFEEVQQKIGISMKDRHP
jgi:hypothetical protein